jgi:hypothetical protein
VDRSNWVNSPMKTLTAELKSYKRDLLDSLEEKSRRLEADLGCFRDDPRGFVARLWPDARPYDRQWEIIQAVQDCDEVVVVSGNKLGKDWCAALICLHAFVCNPECRVVTTSVRGDHIRILWGELERFIQTAAKPLTVDKGGPLILNHWDIRKVVNGQKCAVSYLRGMVSAREEGLAGHHAAYTLLVIDEASGVDDEVYIQGCTWAQKRLIFGNPNPSQGFFRKAVRGGDIYADK